MFYLYLCSEASKRASEESEAWARGAATMHLMYYLDDSGKRVYTLKVSMPRL